MTAYEIIAKKRDGLELTDEEINFLVIGYSNGKIPDYQISAWLMAILLQGLNNKETHAFTKAILDSGEAVDLSSIKNIKIDKHSTGGVGDKVSIILAPIVSAAGITLPMISGRGLGHTGGTLDKLQSIPGFKTDYSIPAFIDKIRKHGTCLMGQTDTITPADKKLYSLRDVTATIPSIPLITASIMSKKIAEGINALVLDVKTGNGAFMKKYSDALNLANSLIDTGKRFGIKTVAYISNMDQPLGYAIGNQLEIIECCEALQGNGAKDLMELTYTLSGTMIYLGGKAATIEDGIITAKKMVTYGKAWNKFLEITAAQEGNIDYLKNPALFPRTKLQLDIKAEQNGYIKLLDAYIIGSVSTLLGAGRLKISDQIDQKAGIILHKKIGEKVLQGEKIMTIYSDKNSISDKLINDLRKSIGYSNDKPTQNSLILNYLDKSKP
jgi:pyrimidine-nucleoside phosphorylase